MYGDSVDVARRSHHTGARVVERRNPAMLRTVVPTGIGVIQVAVMVLGLNASMTRGEESSLDVYLTCMNYLAFPGNEGRWG